MVPGVVHIFETRWIISLPLTKPPVISALAQNASPVACFPLCSLTGGHCFKIHTYKPQITCTLGPLLAEAGSLKDSPGSSSPDSCPLPGMPFSLCLGALSYSSFKARVTSNTFVSCTLCQGTLPRWGLKPSPCSSHQALTLWQPRGRGIFQICLRASSGLAKALKIYLQHHFPLLSPPWPSQV